MVDVLIGMSEGLNQLASLLRKRGLSARFVAATAGVTVVNPISAALEDSVFEADGHYVTGWRYELGELGNEDSVADRLAFLLGVPSGLAPQHAEELVPGAGA
jgi:hypothetical protein